MNDPYAKLGNSAARLIESFMSDRYKQKGMGDHYGKAARANYYNAQSEGEHLDNEQKRRSLDVTANDIIRAMGVTDPDTVRMESAPDFEGPSRFDPQVQDIVRRGDTAFVAHQMGGGKINQIIDAIAGMQAINAQDMAMSGDYDAEKLAESVAASEGKPIYSQGVNGVLQRFSGDLQETDLSKAKTQSAEALAQKRSIDVNKGSGLIQKEKSPRDNYRILVNSFIPKAYNGFAPDVEAIAYGEKVVDEVMTLQYGANWRQKINAGNAPVAPKKENNAPALPDGWSVQEIK